MAETGKGNVCPEKKASFFSRLFLLWVLELKGWKEKLTPADLWDLDEENTSKVLTSQFHSKFYNGKTATKTLFMTMLNLLGNLLLAVGILQILEQIAGFSSTHFFKLLLGTGESNVSQGITYLLLMSAVSAAKTVLNNQGAYQQGTATLRVRSYVMNSIYNKSLTMANYRRSESSMGEILNMMTGDCVAIERFFSCFHLSWSIPLTIVVSLYFQWNLLGPSVLAGFSVMFILMILNVIVGNLATSLSQQEIKDRSQRITLMSEILSAIQEIKLYTLENVFSGRMGVLRNQEVTSILKSALITTALNFCWSFSLFLMSIATFVTYVWIDDNNVLDAQKVFVYMVLANSISGPLKSFPAVVGTIIQARISLQRVQSFLRSADIVPEVPPGESCKENPYAVDITDGHFTVDTFHVRSINVRVKKGSLVAILGKSGSGKSSLLSAMNRSQHVIRASGHQELNGDSCLLTQSPFILNDTIESNILFGLPMQRGKYQRVVDACALTPDLKSLQDGDQTLAGNKGSNLSGGQRQRIALARVLYRDVDIYFLDTPLSAVDGQVGREIFKKVIGPQGMLQGKTRVVVASSLRDLEAADQVHVLANGEIVKSGTFKEIAEWEAELEIFETDPSSPKNEPNPGNTTNVDTPASIKDPRKISVDKKEKIQKGVVDSLERKVTMKLLDREDENVLSSKWSFLPYYLNNCGWAFVISTIATHTAQQGFALASNHWLTKATSQSESLNERDSHRNLMVYALLGIAQGFFNACSSVLLTIGTLRASASLHKMMLHKSLGAKMGFYHMNNTASILASFSRDTGDTDKLMGNRLVAWLSCAFTVGSTVSLILFHRPLFFIVVIPLTTAYMYLLKYFQTKNMQLNRLDIVTQAPIYAQLNESLMGMETIRVLKAERSFTAKFQGSVDRHLSCYFSALVAMRFHSLCLDLLGNLFVFFTGLFVIWGSEGALAGLLGVLLGYAFQVTGALNSLIVVTSMLEGGMAVIQRIHQYQNLAQEEEERDDSFKFTLNSANIVGEISFNQLNARYAEDLDLVLEGVTEIIQPKEKIGIVGRTGSGKSSLMLSLVRILEPDGGSVAIDGIDIANMRIRDLRRIVTVVPQDPVIFSGTVHFNLDPLNERSTEAIWKTLENVGLKEFVQNLPNGLQHSLVPRDPIFSFGQQQLLSLARALLRDTPIMVFDEATSVMDESLEEVINRLMKMEFGHRTILVIAHRLKTIMDASRVMVIRNKRIAECSPVSILLNDPTSHFHRIFNGGSDSNRNLN